MVDRLTLLNSCVSRLKEVGLVRLGLYGGSAQLMFDCPFGLVFKSNYKYKSGNWKKLKTLAKVEEVVTS